MRVATVLALIFGLMLGVAEAQSGEKEKATSPAIENGSKVELEYTLTDDGGKVLDSNKGGTPLTFTHGQRQLIPGLENALDGMHAGEEKKVTVPPAEGYGEVDPKAVTEVPKESIPAEALNVGAELVARNQSGARRMVRVKEIKEKTVVIDLNHPLAGKTLHFDVKVLGVEPPKD